MEDLGSKKDLLTAQRANILGSLEKLSIYFNVCISHIETFVVIKGLTY